MQAFTDAEGREWEVTFDAPRIERIRDRLEFDPVNLGKDPFQAVDDDPCLLVNCLWQLCHDQHPEVKPSEFGEAMVGDVIASAYQAYCDALIAFFPTRKRLLLRSLVENRAANFDQIEEQTLAKIKDPATREKVKELMEAEFDLQIQRHLMRLQSATSSAESSEFAQSE